MGVVIKSPGARVNMRGRPVRLLRQIGVSAVTPAQGLVLVEEIDPPAPALPGQLGFWTAGEIAAALGARRGGLAATAIAVTSVSAGRRGRRSVPALDVLGQE